MQKLFLALSVLAVGTWPAWADPQEDREANMKERGRIVGGLSRIAKGEAPFDAAAVLEQLRALEANAAKADVDALWPAGSEAGSESSPKIWEDMAGFKAASEKYRTEVTAAVAAAPADAAALQATIGTIGRNCGACHEAYRIKD